ncbi:MAG TPA: sensor histidine kinase [Chryseolinea sp.]|nr:sensor histidine kinase [Chryseolinea sp.]
MTEAQAKALINKELAKKEPDYALVSKASEVLLDSDPEHVRFKVDSSLINRLGEELVSKKETAICELIKNSFDADAKMVKVVFDKTHGKEKIKIIDDGNGMNREELVKGFMVLGTREKVSTPYSPVFKRKRGGSKGIGRLATLRLGKKLTVETIAADSNSFKVVVDWNQFSGSENISYVPFPIMEDHFVKIGTTITIEELNDVWTDDDAKNVYKFISDLLQPFSISNKLPIKTDQFDVTLTFLEDGVERLVPRRNKLIFDFPVAEIDSYVEGKNQVIKITSKLLNIKSTRSIKLEKGPLKEVYFKAYYYILGKAGLLTGPQSAKIKEYIDEGRAGIKVYRNGFRVLPYGEPNNDWLGLDVISRKREILTPVGNNNFFGFLSLFDPKETLFKETSNREGLIETVAFEALKEFCQTACTEAARLVGKSRGRKVTASQKEWKESAKPEAKLAVIENQLTDFFEQEVNKLKEKKVSTEEIGDLHTKIHGQVKSAIRLINNEFLREDGYKKSLLEENNMLRVLATLGMSVAEFTHEMRQYIPALTSDLNRLSLAIKDKLSQKILDRLRHNLSGLTTYVGFFDKTVSENSDRTRESQNLKDIVGEFIEGMNADLERSSIEVAFKFDDPKIKTIPMHYSEWSSILFNFFTNSKKAIKKAGVSGKILIRLGKSGSKAFLEFQDNGAGILPQHKEKVFEAFFTTTKSSERRVKGEGDISGSGLGLWIVRQIVESYSGDVYLSTPRSGYSTCFRIEVASI